MRVWKHKRSRSLRTEAMSIPKRSRAALVRQGDLPHGAQIVAGIFVLVQRAQARRMPCSRRRRMNYLNRFNQGGFSLMVDAVVVAGDILRLGRGLAVGISPAQQAIQRARQHAVRYFSMYRTTDGGCARCLAGFPPGEVALRRSRSALRNRPQTLSLSAVLDVDLAIEADRLAVAVARMSDIRDGSFPACRCAHAGYEMVRVDVTFRGHGSRRRFAPPHHEGFAEGNLILRSALSRQRTCAVRCARLERWAAHISAKNLTASGRSGY